MHRGFLGWLFVALLVCTPPAAARGLDPHHLQALAEAHFVAGDSPGLLVVVEQDGARWLGAFGSADLEQARPMQAATILPIASITKVFVAVSILLLQQDGVLTVEDPLARFLPDYPGAEGITLKQLLQHTAGVPNAVNMPAFTANQAKDWTPQELTALSAAAPPSFPPGTACLYSDSGFILLGQVIEAVSGRSFGDFVQEKITTPLGMTTTTMGSNSMLVPLRAAGYRGKKDSLENAPYVSWVAPFSAGGMVSTVGDLAKIAAVLQPGGPLLNGQSRAAMVAPAVLADGSPCSYPLPGAKGSYGFGLELVDFETLPDHRAVGKSGVFPGYGSFTTTFAGSDLAITLIANGDGSTSNLVLLARDLAKELLGE